MIESLDNKQVKLLYKLKRKKARDESGLYVVEGVHLVMLALQMQRARTLFLTQDYAVTSDNKLYKDEVYLGEVTCAYTYISERIVDKIAMTVSSQGIFALCEMQRALYDQTSMIIFDGLQDPGNVGTIIRSAHAFQVHNFYFTRDAVDAYNDKVIRASQGAILLSRLFFEVNDTAILEQVGRLPHRFALDLQGEALQTRRSLTEPFVLVVGNEGSGITHERWQELALTPLTIKIDAQIESLNVAVATGIALYALVGEGMA